MTWRGVISKGIKSDSWELELDVNENWGLQDDIVWMWGLEVDLGFSSGMLLIN